MAFGRNPNTLYLGLGDPYDQILVGGSMVKSRNGGVGWDPMIELGDAVSVRDVKVDTSTNSDIVLVATNSGLYRSADDGQTYSAVPTFAGLSVWSIERTSAGWLASAQACPAANVGLQCGQATTLYLSTDRGATLGADHERRQRLHPQRPDHAGRGRARRQRGLRLLEHRRPTPPCETSTARRTADRPGSPTASTRPRCPPIRYGRSAMDNMNICHGQCWYNQMVLVDPQDATRNTVWIGGDLGSARTTNGGANWTIKTWWLYSQFPTLPYAHADHHAAAFKTTGTPTIILGNDGGLNISTDNGATFSSDKNNGLRHAPLLHGRGQSGVPEPRHRRHAGQRHAPSHRQRDHLQPGDRRRRHGRRLQPGQHQHGDGQLAGLRHPHEPQQHAAGRLPELGRARRAG